MYCAGYGNSRLQVLTSDYDDSKYDFEEQVKICRISTANLDNTGVLLHEAAAFGGPRTVRYLRLVGGPHPSTDLLEACIEVLLSSSSEEGFLSQLLLQPHPLAFKPIPNFCRFSFCAGTVKTKQIQSQQSTAESEHESAVRRASISDDLTLPPPPSSARPT